MILIALGSNISGPWGSPAETVARAMHELGRFPLRVMRASSPLVTKAYGVENQPDFVNAVVAIETALSAETLLRKLHMIERQAGRKRRRRWGPRTLDLDILDARGLIRTGRGRLALPHPGITERRFVLAPLAEIAPRWRHPKTRKSAAEMLRVLR